MGLSQITFVEQKLQSRRNKFLTFQWIAVWIGRNCVRPRPRARPDSILRHESVWMSPQKRWDIKLIVFGYRKAMDRPSVRVDRGARGASRLCARLRST